MFYEPKNGHGLKHDPLKAIIAPRPIGWISTLDGQGRPNLAPYSFFNALGSRPAVLCFSSEGMKHTTEYAIASGEFVFNLSTRPLFDAMNASSGTLPAGVSEFEVAGIEAAPSVVVKPPRVAASPAAMECKVVHHWNVTDMDGQPTGAVVVFGQVVGVHIDEAVLRDGMFDAVAAQTIARCGYRDYTQVTEMFAVSRPDD